MLIIIILVLLLCGESKRPCGRPGAFGFGGSA
jgi:hypothetical protein